MKATLKTNGSRSLSEMKFAHICEVGD